MCRRIIPDVACMSFPPSSRRGAPASGAGWTRRMNRSQWVIGQFIQLGVHRSSLWVGVSPAASVAGAGALGLAATDFCLRKTSRRRPHMFGEGRIRKRSRIGRSLWLVREQSDQGSPTIPGTHISWRMQLESQRQLRRRGSL